MRQLFQRSYDFDRELYNWDVSSSFPKREIDTLKKRTRDNALFLSTAVQNNFSAFMDVFSWVRNDCHVIGTLDKLADDFTSEQINSGMKKQVLQFIQSADIKICDILVEEGKFEIPPIMEKVLVAEEKERLINMAQDMKSWKVKTVHKKKGGGDAYLNLHEESDGTRKIYAYAGPILDVLENGYTLIVDELNSSLHPIMMRYIVDLFNSSESNPKNAQLIFTSHETHVLSGDVLHKDQIWLVEKDSEEKSRFYPLSDFEVRDTDSFQRAYLSGRYGAVPLLKSVHHGK
ncbi:hypothetical protein ABAC460_20840 [Asticcacaulis sp. AC460]|nr:hypothetical protein ABAC460_20840 [Asticcacaulis sp. AC460]